jgi:hypothetical protein
MRSPAIHIQNVMQSLNLTKSNLKKLFDVSKKQQFDEKSLVSNRSRTSSRGRRLKKSKNKRRGGLNRKIHLQKHLDLVRPHVLRRSKIADPYFHDEKGNYLGSDSSQLKAGQKIQVKYKLKAVKDYFDQKDLKTSGADLQKELDQLNADIDLVKGAFRAGLNGKSMMVHLCVETAVGLSAGGTPYFPVTRLRPSDSSEFSSLAALFDEYKMVSAKIYNKVMATTAVNSTAYPGPHNSFSYDPVNNTPHSTATAPIISEQHAGPYSFANNTGSYTVTKTGFQELFIKCPSGPQYEYGSPTSIGTGTWMDTALTAVDYGYIKHAIDSAGGSVTTTQQEFDVMHVDFKCRS